MSTVTTILIFTALALVIRLLSGERWRGWLLLVSSALAVYWLQPVMPLRYMDFWLPSATLLITVLSWLFTTPGQERGNPQNRITALVLAGLVLVVGLTRFVSYEGILTAARPPQFAQVVGFILITAGVAFLFWRFSSTSKGLLWGGIIVLVALFVFIKTPALSQMTSTGLRSLMGQSADMASAVDIRWLGFSYVAFRLIHTLRDRMTGRLPLVTLQEYVIYVIFFPAFTAGPIDRLERFIKDIRQPLDSPAGDFTLAGKRLALGLLKKFIIADSLALFAMSADNALFSSTAGWTWVMLYAYAFQIYFDFSGYTDIAIGMGHILGITLPENFMRPYLKPNLTQFWNNWHMTLTQWFRAYFFNPITRAMRRSRRYQAWLIILVTQIVTMVLIGLWHGVTWNFVLWGLWHALGLFVQNRWSEWTKPKFVRLREKPAVDQVLNGMGVLLTFHYVALGWVWFALPSPDSSLHVFARLFGG